jgi:hypothetical protein
LTVQNVGPGNFAQTAIAFDLHGLVLDHRLAKHRYFRDVVGVPYSNPLQNRRQILAELASRGYDESFYRQALVTFFSAIRDEDRTLKPGFQDFVAFAKPFARLFLVTNADHNTPERVQDAFKTAGFQFPGEILVAKDSGRISVLLTRGVTAYFDDKPDLIECAHDAGLVTIQVNETRYENQSLNCDFFFESWHQALQSVQLKSSLKNLCSRESPPSRAD